MITQKIPHALAVHAAWISHAAILGAAFYLYYTGKIDGTAFAAIVATLGAAWAGVAGALISVAKAKPVTVAAGGSDAPGTSATPAAAVPGTIRTDH